MTSLSHSATGSHNVISKSDIEILSQEISEDEAMYRIRARNRIQYLKTSAHVDQIFDEFTLCRPFLLIPKLPPFPDADWTEMRLFRGLGGSVVSTISFEPLAEIQSRWHPRCIEVLSLKKVKSLKQRVQEVEYEGRKVFSKTAIFDWWIPQLEQETLVYELLAKNQRPENISIAPKFLGHLTEQGRMVGSLLERNDGDFASHADLPECDAALRRLHSMGLVHGDANRYNFVVERSTGHVKIIDFEHVEMYDEEKVQLELQELAAELMDETGRGAAAVCVDGAEIG